jgi:prepilin-type N-terminal cleavage/methylation domain-containing protein
MIRSRGFTLIEIVLAIFIMVLILGMAVPSLKGVFADKKLRKTYDGFNELVRRAQETAIKERRPYLLVWHKASIGLESDRFARKEDEEKGEAEGGEQVRESEEEEPQTVGEFHLDRGERLTIVLPAALMKDPPGKWTFWGSGICEPALIEYHGPAGTWIARYHALTARPEIIKYETK